MQCEAVAPLGQEMSEETLKRFDWYIVAQVHQLSRHYPTVMQSSVVDLEIDELAQCVRIKLWQALAKRDIHYPYAYIKLMVRNEFIDRIRRQKPVVLLPTYEEFVQNQVPGVLDRYVPDPADELEQREETSARLREIVQAVLALPPRQRFAMICLLRDRVDNLVQLVEAFKAYKVDIEGIGWPVDKEEKQLLQASLVPARKTIAKNMRGRKF